MRANPAAVAGLAAYAGKEKGKKEEKEIISATLPLRAHRPNTPKQDKVGSGLRRVMTACGARIPSTTSGRVTIEVVIAFKNAK